MRKTILAGFLILFTVSCAPLMEETWTVTTPKGPVTVRHYDPARELLMGFYISSLITNPPKARNNLLLSSYYYPLISPPYRAYSGPNGLPTWEDVIYEQRLNSVLRDHDYNLKSINDMQMFQMKLDNQSLIDDLKREMERAKDELERKKEEAEDAADELEDAAYDAKIKLEDATSWAEFRLKSAADDADFERLVAENAASGLPVFSGKEKSREASKNEAQQLIDKLRKKYNETRVLSAKKRKTFSTEELFSEPSPPPGFILDTKKTAPEKVLGGEIGQIIGKSEDQVEVFGPDDLSEKKQFVSVGVDYAKRARPFVFLLESPMPGEVVLYGRRWPPKDPINWREEKEVSRTVTNGLANAIKEIIDELGER